VAEEPQAEPSRVGKFIQTYHSFLSTFVIGAAGLIATSIWQYRQSQISSKQAESQQAIAKTQAENSWRIERAEILSKNLQVLTSPGGTNIEQRYGVLLSLTRGNILDPELAVSYALELGKDSPEYMKSVLANTGDKSYTRLASAFELTCLQRYGVARDVPLCKNDKDADRSTAIAELIADETDAAKAQGKPGPLTLLADERTVQEMPARLAWLFTPFLQGLYDRRLWSDIDKFEHFSTGATLVSALVLGPPRPNELVAASEQAVVQRFHDDRMKWLLGYVFGPTCGGECKGKLIDLMVTLASEAHGRFDDALRMLFKRPRNETAAALSRLHTRLLACQLTQEDLAALRDQVLVPVLAEELGAAKPDPARLNDILGLLALAPPTPEDKNNPAPHKAWMDALKKAREVEKGAFQREYMARREAAARARTNPPPSLRKAMFCTAAESESPDINLGEN
jgi:hypothetical protein